MRVKETRPSLRFRERVAVHLRFVGALNIATADRGCVEYLFTVGSTGDPPVPSGDPPDGMGAVSNGRERFSHIAV
jgi:hypothetical protein